jgi:hypothetical protein
MYKIPIKKFEPTPDEKRQAAMDKAYYNKKTEFGVGYGGEPTYPKTTKPKLNALNKLKK